MKVNITGASNFVNRMFEACGNYQWAREFLRNSIEANASKVEFGIEWQAVEKHGLYRRTVIDNGDGMTPDELLHFFSTLGLGAKTIGGVHDNFGVGAKIASLPWNPEGLVVMSFRDGKASMIHIVLDPESNEYELVDFDTGPAVTCVIDPTTVDWGDDINWGAVAPDWVREHGTVIVLLGSEEYPDTVLGNYRAAERDIKGLSVYLNTRFWDLSKMEVRVAELRSDKKNAWPQSREEKEDSRRPNNRRIMGAKYYLTDVSSTTSRLDASGSLLLDEDRVIADWYLWEGERPNIHMYAKKPGYVAVRYKDELFELTSAKPMFRNFGVSESKVQQNLTIILEPQLYDPTTNPWGAHPDQSRNHLIFTGGGEKGVSMPMSDWGLEFADNLPEQIMAAIRKVRGELEGTIENEEYRKRLQDKFGTRWTVKRLVMAKPDDSGKTPNGNAKDETLIPDTARPTRAKSKRKRNNKTMHRVRLLATSGGSGEAVEMEVPVDVPRFRFAEKDDFLQPWHLAMWSPNEQGGPCVFINQDSPMLLEAIRYHQEQYPDVYADEVRQTVMHVYGEVAVAKIAHSQKLAAMARISEQELDSDYRNEAALTVALMGLLAEETVIGQRLGKLGRKRPSAA